MNKYLKKIIQSLLILVILSVSLIFLSYKLPIQAQASGETSFTLELDPATEDNGIGNTFNVILKVRSDVTATNLYSAKISYDPAYLKIISPAGQDSGLDMKTNSFITTVVEATSSASTINLIGGYNSSTQNNSGFLTSETDPPSTMATITFQRLVSGSTTLSFIPLSNNNLDGTAIYSNATNQNVLDLSPDLVLDNTVTPTPAPIPPTPTPTAQPASSGSGGSNNSSSSSGGSSSQSSNSSSSSSNSSSGDVNNDGKVDLLDLSILLAQYNTPNSQADCNHDGSVNLLDLSILLSHYQGG